EAYHGQVTEGNLYEGDDDADDGENWFTGPLKFKRHIDDDLRKGSDGRRADDYAVIDPLKQQQQQPQQQRGDSRDGRDGRDRSRGGGDRGDRDRGGRDYDRSDRRR
ncbi:unnamed protein product, partial [Hapterophycus canaliculatus]